MLKASTIKDVYILSINILSSNKNVLNDKKIKMLLIISVILILK